MFKWWAVMRRRSLLLLVPGVLFLGACELMQPPPKPNVILLLTDDQRPDTIAALGNQRIVTPHLDRLVNSGFVFTNAYCLGSNVPAVCAPSRNMLLSGRAYFRWEGRYAPPEPANLADSMREAGYETHHHGKKGNTAREIHPRFDHTQYLDDGPVRRSGKPGKEIVDAAIEFLSGRTDASGRSVRRPFFMYLAFATPHDPRVASEEYLDMYPPESIPLPPNYLPVHPFDNGEMVIRDELLAPWPRTENEIRQHLRDYYAVISALDEQVGRLMTFLEENGLSENTYIIFSSDQGLAIGSHGLMGKQNLYDHSAGAPLIIAGPDIEPGRSDALVYLLDLYPTILSLVGASPAEGLDGVSLAPIIYRQDERVRRSLFLAYRDVQRAVRDERYKLIVYPHNNARQLFDLENDPHELKNLAGEPQYERRVNAMLEAIAQWQEQLGDTVPLMSENPSPLEFEPPRGEELRQLYEKWNMEP